MKEYRENSIPGNPAASLDHIKPCWYWDKKDLAHTPSQSEGLDPATEARYRREGARFIFDVGTRLGLHYDTLATGIIYFHRFYMFHSFKQFPRYVTGGCCLFLAGKVEETPKKCKDIIKTARSLLNDIQFAQFGDDPKEEVMVLERILLQTIKFDLQVEHPYQFLLRYAKQLKDLKYFRSVSGDKNKVQKLVQMAWTFVNDSLCTMLSLQWEPEIIAVAVMYLAGRLCKFDIQEWTSKQSSRRWWEQFVQDVPVELLEDICHQILDLYSQGKQQMPQTPSDKTPPIPVPTPTPQQLQALSQPPLPSPPVAPPLSKKVSPQTSPPRQLKRAHVSSPKEESQAPEPVGSKIPRLEPPMPPLPTSQPPSDRKPPASHPSAPLPGETDPTGAGGPAEPPKGPPPPPHSASLHQPPPLPHRPPPPPPSSYIMGIPTSSSYMSGEGFQSLQSMMKTEGPSYSTIPPSYGPPLAYHSHVYPPNAPPPGPPLSASYPPPNLPPPSPAYPPPGYNHSYPPPPPHCMPPGHGEYPPVMGIPPSNYPPPPGGQGQVPPPLPPGMPPIGGMSQGAWMR
ncbi:cyclin-K-like isoform X1 [Oncorhynchus masou masou]|uniref:cyclin-K-like isoform X1 n=1 Tax=Oncorhynchus masou masou TaxID=90313 RepID=UPI000D0A1E88|nr:cyclin-K isoform X1 [Oncorhynchus nerka]